MTMIAAVGMAFGLFADVDPFVSGTNFNSENPGTFAGGTEATLWSGFATDNQNKIVDVGWTSTIAGMIPEEYKEAGAGYSLAVKTTLGNPIARTCGATPISGDAYVDMMAQFTVFDEAPDFTATGYADAKIAIWLQEATNTTGDVTGTNVWLYAGNFATGTAAAYNCGSIDDEKYTFGDWNRVTIKSINNAGSDKQAFVAFINGIPLEMAEEDYNVGALPAGATASTTVWYNQRKLFPSIQTERSVKAVAFDGQGGVDDIVFATNADATHRKFAMDPAAYTISWDTSKMTDVKTNGFAVVGTSPVVVPGAKPDSMNISWTGVGNYASGKNQPVTDFDLTKIDVSEADATFNDVNWMLADAITEANAAATAGTLKLLANAAQDIAFTKAGTTLDLNGFNITGSVSGDIILANSDAEKTSEIVGAYTAAGSIVSAKVKFDADNNWWDGEGVTITATPPEGYKFALATPWVVFQAVNYVAQIGDKKYESIAEAVAAAKDGDTIKIIANADVSEKLTITSKGTITFENNATVTFADLYEKGDYSVVIDDTTVNFTGTGTWTRPETKKNTKTGAGGGSVFRCGATTKAIINITSGTFIAGTNLTGEVEGVTLSGASAIFQAKNAEITVNGGEFTNERIDEGRCVRADADTSVVTIKGGKFWTNPEFKGGSTATTRVVPVDNKGAGTVSITGGQFKCHPDNVTEIMNPFCGEGYKLKDDGTGWLVRTAIDYATLTVTKDANVAAVVVSNATEEVTLDVDGKAKFDKDDAVVVTAYPTFAAGYELDTEKSTVLTATMTANATIDIVSKSAGPVYPSYIPEGAPEEIKQRYAGWASKYSVTDGDGKMDYYLLDCDPANESALEAAQKAFKIASIENVEGEWQVKVVNDKGEGELIGQNGLYKNGYVNIISVKEAKFPTAGDDADFFQAQLTVQPTVKGE